VDNGWLNPQFLTASKTGSVTVMVTPFSEYSAFGTFAVVFSAVSIRPDAAVSKTITENQWVDDTIAAHDIHVYTINVTQKQTYYVWWNERGDNGDGLKTAYVQVQARYADDTLIFNQATSYADKWADTAWTSPQAFTANITGTVDLRVRPYNDSIAYPGTYGIVYSTDSERPFKDSATLTGVTANGGSGTPTTELTLVFDKSVSGLSASDITLTKPGLFGVTKGALSGDGPTYTLGVSAPVDGTVTLTIGNVLFDITGSPAQVSISGDTGIIKPLVENQWADGYLPERSSIDWYQITVSADIEYYVWWNEKGSDGDGIKTADVVVGAWRADESNIFGSTNFTVDGGWSSPQSFTPSADGIVYLRVRPYNAADYVGTYGVVYSTVNSRPEIIYPDDTPVTLESVTANGGSGTPTTALTLTFDQAIPGLNAGDITLTISSPFGVTKGTLSGNGPTYTLEFGTPLDGTLTVKVDKRFYIISGSPTEVSVYGNGSVTVTPLVANQWANGSVPNASSVSWYSITVTASTTYRIWWNDRDQGDSSKTADVAVGARYADGTVIFGDTDTTVDQGWETGQSFTPSANGTVYVRVMPYNGVGTYTGTFGIVFSTGATRPLAN
jgi:hypothetical protein